MKNIMKFEIDKTANNISFLVTTMITIIIMGCIFFTGFHYSQLSLVEKNNAAKGVNDLYWKMAETSPLNIARACAPCFPRMSTPLLSRRTLRSPSTWYCP